MKKIYEQNKKLKKVIIYEPKECLILKKYKNEKNTRQKMSFTAI